MTEYCPHTPTCPFYKNWTEKTKDRRTDVILVKPKPSGEKGGYYGCLPLIALEDPVAEGGITMTNELKTRLSHPKQKIFDCSHLTLLNGIGDLEVKVNDLLLKK